MKKTRKAQGANAVDDRGTGASAGSTSAAGTPSTELRYSIGDLASELSITTRTIRFYESKGLISPARKGVARAYNRRDRVRLMLILRGKNLGFSLDDIKQYLELYDADPMRVAQLKLLESKVDAHIEKLMKKRADLDRTLKELQEIRAAAAAQLAERERSAG